MLHPFSASDVVFPLIRIKGKCCTHRFLFFEVYFYYYITTNISQPPPWYIHPMSPPFLLVHQLALKTSYVDSFLSLTTSRCFYFLVFTVEERVSSLQFPGFFCTVRLFCEQIELLGEGI